MTEYEWEAVCSLWGIRLTAAQQAAGCPDAFEPCNLAIMQRPAIRTSPDRGAELKSQRDILAKIEAAIAAGTLHASIQTRTVPVTKTVTVPDLTAPRRNWVTDWEFSDFRPPMVQKTVKTGEREEGYKVIDRAAFRDWLNARGEPPSVHIQAWIRALDSAATGGEEQSEPPRLTPMRRAAIIDQLERRYSSLKSDFNRPADWVRECATGKRGEYYLEKIEAGCRSKWGNGEAPAPLAAVIHTHKMRG
jgi:hypothetical protein